MTKQKLLIMDIINSHCGHLTAEEIYDIAKEKMPKIALGTVYRNLGSLCEEGIIGTISVSGKPDRFEKCINDHGHIICEKCGQISDFEIPISQIKGDLEKSLNIEITACCVSAGYICNNCKES